jgi:hypothetical protein
MSPRYFEAGIVFRFPFKLYQYFILLSTDGSLMPFCCLSLSKDYILFINIHQRRLIYRQENTEIIQICYHLKKSIYWNVRGFSRTVQLSLTTAFTVVNSWHMRTHSQNTSFHVKLTLFTITSDSNKMLPPYWISLEVIHEMSPSY